MTKCIYYKNSNLDLTFDKQEHVIPASLGGINKLPKGFVSDKANELFSNELEREFTRNSLISIPRSMVGPGTRGNLNPEKATQTEIHLLSTNDTIGLGYIELAKPYYISQCYCDIETFNPISFKSSIKFSLNSKVDLNNITHDDYKVLLLFNKDRYSIIQSDIIPDNQVILGVHKYFEKGKGKAKYKSYIASNTNLVINQELINTLFSHINLGVEQLISNNSTLDISIEKSQPKSNRSLAINIDNESRTYAKIAFNCFAFLYGKEITLKDEFDLIRDSIILGGASKLVFDFNGSINDILSNKLFKLPKDSHSVIICNHGNEINALVTFYGVNTKVVKICKNTTNLQIKDNYNGLICDWINRSEYNLLEFISNLNKQ